MTDHHRQAAFHEARERFKEMRAHGAGTVTYRLKDTTMQGADAFVLELKTLYNLHHPVALGSLKSVVTNLRPFAARGWYAEVTVQQ